MVITLQGNYESSFASREQALATAIGDLYSIFKKYTLRAMVGGCPHCVYPEDNARIHSKPLHQLTAEDLESFSRKVLTTWGDEDDLRHFLPRLLELLLEPEFVDRVYPPIIAGKLRNGNWIHWPAREKEALHSFFHAYWQWHLGNCQKDGSDIEEVICTIANAIDDLSPYIAMWQADEMAPSTSHLAEFIAKVSEKYLKHGELPDAFWSDAKEQSTQITEWLQSPTLERHVERLFFLHEDTEPQLATALSDCLPLLVAIRNRRTPKEWETRIR